MASSGAELNALLSHAAWLRRLARQLAEQSADADDLLQDTWTAAWRRPPDAGRPARPWLAEVLRNFARMSRRTAERRRGRELDADAAAVEPIPGPDERLARVELQRRLAELILELEEPYRSTVLLRYYEDRSASEIAEHEGIAAATVRWRLKQGLTRLRAGLDQRYGGDRRAWLLAVPAAGPRAAWLGKGVLMMKMKTKLAAGLAILLLLAVGAGLWWRQAAGPGADVSAETHPPRTGIPRPALPWQTRAPTTASLGMLDGVVVDAESRPVAGALVALARWLESGATAPKTAGMMAGTTTTGIDGRFQIRQLPPGTFTATATSPRAGLMPAVERGIEITSGVSQNVRLMLSRGGFVLGGRVLEAGGGVLPAARVTVRATPSAAKPGNEEALVFLTASDARGTWSVTLPAGQYAVSGEFDGYAPGSISLTLTADRRADLVLEPASGIFGRVVHALTEEPIAGARVQAIPGFRRGRWAPAVVSDADGRFRLQQLGMGDVLVQARRGRLVGRGGPMAVVPARAVTGLEIRVQEAFAISGRVLAADGQPAAGVVVMAEGNSGSGVSRGETTASGDYTIEGVMPGDHQVQVWLKDGGRARRDVTVASEDVTGADLRITAGLVVRGHVDDQRGRPAAGVRVIVTTEAGADAARYNRIATSDARGDFQLPPDIPWGTLSARAGQHDQGIALWGPGPTEPGSVVQVNLKLEDGARLTGLVRQEDGSPARGAHVLIVNPEGERGERAETVTGPDGRYRLAALAPGWARGAAGSSSSPRFEDGYTRVQLIAGQEATLDLRVPAETSIRGLVRLADGRPGGGALVLAGASGQKPWAEQARRALAGRDGAFQIDGLARGRRYHLWIDLPGHTGAHLADIAAGASDVRVSLSR